MHYIIYFILFNSLKCFGKLGLRWFFYCGEITVYKNNNKRKKKNQPKKFGCVCLFFNFYLLAIFLTWWDDYYECCLDTFLLLYLFHSRFLSHLFLFLFLFLIHFISFLKTHTQQTHFCTALSVMIFYWKLLIYTAFSTD